MGVYGLLHVSFLRALLAVVAVVQNSDLEELANDFDISEGTNGRTLRNGYGGVPGGQMTIVKCVAGCEAAGYKLAGAEYGGECCK